MGNLAFTLVASFCFCFHLYLLLSTRLRTPPCFHCGSEAGNPSYALPLPPPPPPPPTDHQQVIPLPQKRHLTLPTLPILLLLLGTGFLLHSLFFSPSVPASLAPAGKYTSSPFLVKPSDFIDPPPPDRPSYIPEPVEPKKKGMLVPDAVHYVYGLKPVPEGQRGEELPYYAYLAMRSALINLSPKVIYLYVTSTLSLSLTQPRENSHYEHLPTGPWWDLIRPHLTLIKTQVPESIYGRPLKHFAHKADVLRLLAMKYSGGIYLDIDIYVYVESYLDNR